MRPRAADRFRLLPQVVRAPGLTFHRRAAHEADGFLREGQADQQRAGPTRTCEFDFWIQIFF